MNHSRRGTHDNSDVRSKPSYTTDLKAADALDLDALLLSGEALLAASNVQEALNIVGSCAEKYVGAKRVSFAEQVDGGSRMRITGLVGVSTGGEGMEVPMEDAGIESVFLDRKPAYYSDLSQSPLPLHQSFSNAGLTQAYSVPVLRPNGAVSVLNIAVAIPVGNFPESFSILHTLARFLGVTLHRMQAQLETQQTLNRVIDDNPSMTALLDCTGVFLRVSRFGANTIGFDADVLEGKHFTDIHPKDNLDWATRRFDKWCTMDHDEVDVTEVEIMLPLGQRRWVRQSVRTSISVEGNKQLLIAFEDIHELRDLILEREALAKLDPLTGMHNRKEFTRYLEDLVINEPTAGSELAVMFIDLDQFKDINDTLGHHIGDQMLQEVAHRLSDKLPDARHGARIGGDEFVVLVRGDNSVERLSSVAQEYIAVLTQPVVLDRHHLQVGATIGICRFPDDESDYRNLLKSADIAMYRAKQKGRNGFEFFSSELATEVSRRATMERDMQRAIEEGELYLEFQPQFNLSSSRPEGIEALVRWQHPQYGKISPDVFIPVAESSGQIAALTDWVLESSLQTLTQVNKLIPGIKMSVNVSATEFGPHSTLLQRLHRILPKSNVSAQQLQLELTETALLKNPEYAMELINQINELGVELAIDDFGTGYASLNYLVHLPIDVLKIDRSFVDDVEIDERKQIVVSSIIEIAKKLDVDCVAEGIETVDQLKWLVQQNCSHAQGYHLCRPVPTSELIDFLNSFSKSVLKAA